MVGRCVTLHVAEQELTLIQTIKAGTGIIAACQSGNRDEEVFPNPDEFDMHRKFNRMDSLGFGYGQHRCVAELLAKAELEIVFGKPIVDCLMGLSIDLNVQRHCSGNFPT